MAEKISANIADKMVNGEWKHVGFKGEHYSSPKNGNVEVYLRSSYEVRFAQMLDESDNVICWEHEPFRIPYLFEGSTHNYVPDFLITHTNDERELVEVKPAVLRGSDVVQTKESAARAWCDQNGVSFRIVSEADLNIQHS